MEGPKILIIDDSKAILTMMKAFLKEDGYDIQAALSARDGLTAIERQKPGLVIMDIKMPDMNGLDALVEVKKIDSKLPVIIMTAYGTTQTAIEAMKKGAYDYVTKPFNTNKFKVLIKKAFEAGRLMKESVSYQVEREDPAGGVCIIGNSLPMQEIYKIIGKVAESNATVLIRGESGTGKELVARAIYQNSSRKDKLFLEVNCAAIPESLLESELFGHERGAFTGAINKRIGKFQQCEGGTIFLDEIGDMSLSTQTKVLRVLQEHTFQPVGSEKTVMVDVRVIASTNKDLWRAIEKGEFREDLYYRLKVVTIYMPPLWQRKEDIPRLVKYFIQKFNTKFNKNIKGASEKLIAYLKAYKWPGNVRELENAVQTAVIMSKKDILLLDDFLLYTSRLQNSEQKVLKPDNNCQKFIEDSLKSISRNSAFRSSLHKQIMGNLEKLLIKNVMDKAGGNQIKAAKILGISRNTLRARMKEYNLIDKGTP